MKTVLNLVLFIFLISPSAHAGIVDDIKGFVRPHLVKIIGQEQTDSLLGLDPNKIALPTIPQVEKDAKSVAHYGGGPKNKVKFKKDQLNRYNYVFVQEVFEATRKSSASANDVAKWMNVLSQNGSREGVYRALVLDNTYAGLENFNQTLNPGSADFTMYYLGKFLNKSIEKDSLEQANFYTVKREITERTLEIIDAYFAMSGDEVYNWYAIFSADVAKKFPKAMNNSTRKELSPEKHKAWAKSVPDQFIKSEVIIKLHNIFNITQG